MPWSRVWTWGFSDWGLFVAAACCFVIVLGGVLDFGLWWFGLETITEKVWEERWKGVVILAVWHLGGIALAVHFYLHDS